MRILHSCIGEYCVCVVCVSVWCVCAVCVKCLVVKSFLMNKVFVSCLQDEQAVDKDLEHPAVEYLSTVVLCSS